MSQPDMTPAGSTVSPDNHALGARIASATGTSGAAGLSFAQILADVEADAPAVISLIEGLLPLFAAKTAAVKP